MKLKGKVALVTGASRGIGKEIALTLAREGSNVVIWDLNVELGKEVTEQIKKLGSKALFFRVDISNFEQVSNAVKTAAEEFGGIYILVNNAGITKDTLIIRMKEEDWNRVIAVNLNGVFNCTKEVIPVMMKKRWGRIINITSVIGIIGNKGQANYAASKAGIIGFTKSIAKEVASRNITCNAIAPGYIETDMTSGLSESVKEAYIKSIPLARAGTTSDVANLVLFLAQDESSYITGQVINVDGGMVM
jgi:3-oxoacyl-[acyl-carrier protein] reductase